MKLSIIAAVGANRVIGSNGGVPWTLPEDLKRFKRITMGHAVLMGRRTFESIGHPLEGRRNVVLSSRPLQGVETYPSVSRALASLQDEGQVYVIGGGKVSEAFFPLADELLLTLVRQEAAGDTLFPEFEETVATAFALVSREDHDGYSFVHYVRKTT